MSIAHAKSALLLTMLLAGRSFAADHRVLLVDAFPPSHMLPNALTIAVGDTVTFLADGNEAHNAHALDDSFRCSNGCRGDGSGATGDPGRHWQSTLRFTRPGVIYYGCDAHPSTMIRSRTTATITVVAAPTEFDQNQSGLSGAWANPATDSQGFVFDLVSDFYGAGNALLFGGWFTYDTTAPGGVRWYTIQGQLGPAHPSTIDIFETLGGRFDSAQATHSSAIGTATVGFSDCTHGTVGYAFDDGRSGSIPLTRLLTNVTCTTGVPSGASDPTTTSAAWSGAWADVANSGQGFVFEFNPVQDAMFAAWYTFGADAAADAGPSGQAWYTLQAAAPDGANALHDIDIYSVSGGVFDQHATTTVTRVGSADLTLHSCTSATLTYAFSDGANAGRSGTLDLSRISPAPAGCRLWP